MPTDEERFATMQGKYPADNPIFLSMAVGTYDTQERGSRFTLNNIHPNLDLGGGLGTGDIFDAPAEPEAEPIESEGDESEGEPTEAGADESEASTEDGADDQADQAPAGDAPAVQAQAGAAEGAGDAPTLGGPEGAAEPTEVPVTTAPVSADQLPDGWESLPIAELRELAARLGVEVTPQSPKVGIISRIRAAIES